MRVIICGDRAWRDPKLIYRVMKRLDKDADTVIEGEAHGADEIARIIADLRDISVEPYPADWCDFGATCTKPHTHYGKRAGMMRNKAMLEAGPEQVWAFHDNISASKGTKGMIQMAVAAGVPTILFSHSAPEGVRLNPEDQGA